MARRGGPADAQPQYTQILNCQGRSATTHALFNACPILAEVARSGACCPFIPFSFLSTGFAFQETPIIGLERKDKRFSRARGPKARKDQVVS